MKTAAKRIRLKCRRAREESSITMKDFKFKVGDEIKVWWFTNTPNNMATIIEILPYKGLYKQFFDCVLKLTAPNTRWGWVEMSYNSKDFPN